MKSPQHAPPSQFAQEVSENVRRLGADNELRNLSRQWIFHAASHNYTHNFRWLGLPIIQFPQDAFAAQELVWDYKPDLIIETGVARGGSLVFYASLLELIGNGEVVGVEIALQPDNRHAIESHPLAKRIRLVDGSSTAPETVAKVYAHAATKMRVMVILDSNHTHDHVLAELRAYAPLVRAGGHLIVFDTGIEEAPEGQWPNRPWRKGNSPGTALRAFLAETDRFTVDHDMDARLQISVAPGGYLRCIKDPA
jgi:cephalosporin hydroxylase